MHRLKMKLRIGLAAAALLLPLAGQAGDEELQRQEFRAALAEARANRVPVKEDSTLLRRSPLYPYLEATRIQQLIARAEPGVADAAASRFVDAHPDLAITRELRRQWLLDLARRGQWSELLVRYVPDSAEPALACHRFAARIASGDEFNLEKDLLDFWTAAPQMPPACVAPFDWLQQRGAITADATEARARKALAAGNTGFAAQLIATLPAERAAPLQQWRQLLDDPQNALTALAAEPARSVETPALKAGFEKLGRRDPFGAEKLLRQFDRKRLGDEVYGEATRAIALGLAWNRAAEAPGRFQVVPAAALDDRSHEWRIRAALWNRQWPLAAQWLAALPPAMAAEPRWTYWRARVAEELGQRDAAKAIYQQLLRDNGYYPVLAAWRLNAKYEPHGRKLAEQPELQKRLLALPALIRARELYYAGEINWANAEWRIAMQDQPAAEREQAAMLAARWGWHWQTVLLLNQLNASDVFELMYPPAYAREIARGAKEAELPANWVYGVMRQESLFLPQAVSSADALGLLQLKLSTARDVAKKIGAPRPERDDLFDPALNLRLGTAYLRQMTDRFDGQLVLTLSAYNAGPNAVARWLPGAPLDADIWIENVPFNETRGYVQRILWHITVHAWQQGGETHDLDALLKPVHRPES